MTMTFPMRAKDRHSRGAAALAAVLPRSAELRSAGAAGQLLIGGTKVAVAWAGEGSKGDVRNVLHGDRRPDVIAARRLSPGVREELSGAGVGWVDETGAAEIAVGPIIVSRTGREPQEVEKPPKWTPAVVAVAGALLCGVRGTVAAAREATGLSSGSCANALRALTDLGLLEEGAKRGRDSARRLGDPDALLGAYATAAEALRSPVSVQVGVAWRDPAAGFLDVGGRWSESGLDWAATGALAAGVLAPYLTSVTSVEVYVGAGTMAELEATAAAADLRPIEGGRLTLRPFPDAATLQLAETISGLRIAPWPRVYADLLTTGVRGEEAAEHLREVRRAR